MTGSAPVAAGTRISWDEVPPSVRAAVVGGLRSPVVSAVTQLGGFSPGAAVRIRCANGTRVFVKACGTDLNPDTPDLHRAEADALARLPMEVPHARLLASYDDGDWVALVLEDVDGRRPSTPWSAADVATVGASLERIGRAAAPAGLPAFAARAQLLGAWDEIAADPTGVGPDVLSRLPDFLARQELARKVTVGDRLVHWDARSDNILLRDGQAVLLDWAWACRGAGWLDTLLLALDLRIQGGPDPDEFLATSPMTRDVSPEHLASVVACAAGVWLERARRPAPPGLPTIRPWQARCGATAAQWLAAGTRWR